MEHRVRRGLPPSAPGAHDARRRLRGSRTADRVAGYGSGGTMSSERHAIVVGAGVAGLCCAYYLRQRDFRVTVIESNRVGSGASWGNGGWLCPAQSGPLPEPGLTLGGLRMLFNADSALYFSPASPPQVAPWLLRVLTYLNQRSYRY